MSAQENAMNAVATITPEAAQLPSLIMGASRRLAEATTAGEVLEAREIARLAQDTATAALRVAKIRQAKEDVVSAINHARADGAEIEYRAERRFAEEYDEAQERGLVAGHGGDRSKVQNANLATLSDLGVSKREMSEFREGLAAEVAEPGITRRVLDEQLTKGGHLRRTAMLSAFRETRQVTHTVTKRDRREPQDKDGKVAAAIVRGCTEIANGLDILGLERIADALDLLDGAAGNLATIRNAHTALGKLLEVCDG